MRRLDDKHQARHPFDNVNKPFDVWRPECGLRFTQGAADLGG